MTDSRKIRDNIRTRIDERLRVRHEERVEVAAIALYENTRGHVYSGPEWDWPNIDKSYDRDDEDEYPEGVEPDPEWLRNRYRSDARAVLAAADAFDNSIELADDARCEKCGLDSPKGKRYCDWCGVPRGFGASGGVR